MTMATTTTISTTETIVFPPRPPTVNNLPVDQRARLLRSTRKVGDMLGAIPRLLDEEAVVAPRPLSSASPGTPPPTPLSPVIEVEPPTPSVPPSPTTVRRQRRRKMAKLQRTLGEPVDPRLVFPAPTITPCPRRSSLEPVFESSKTTLKPPKKSARPTPAPLLPPIRKSSQALVIIEQNDDGEWELVSTPVKSKDSGAERGIMGLGNHSAPHLSSLSLDPISHRHTKSDVAPLSPDASLEVKRRKSNHRSASIVDLAQIKFTNEGDWNHDDMEEVRRKLRDLKAM